MRKLILFVLMMMVGNFVMAQAPAIEWAKCYGGSGNDICYSMCNTKDGGYILAGATNSSNGDAIGNHGDWDAMVIKLDSNGSKIWEKCYGSSSSEDARCIQQTFDGGYIMAAISLDTGGDVTSAHGNDDYWIVKLNDTGKIVWQKSMGGQYDDLPFCIKQTIDSGYIISGVTNSNDGDVSGNHIVVNGTQITIPSDYWIVKLDQNGVVEWKKCYGGYWNDVPGAILQTADKGYIVVGNTTSTNGDVIGYHGNTDCWILKLNDTGNIEWSKCYGGTNIDMAGSILQTPDSGYIVAGSSRSNDGDITNPIGNNDVWVLKLSNNGTIQWERNYGGTSYDKGTFIGQDVDSSFVIVGNTNSNDVDVNGLHGSPGGFLDYWVLKIKNNGTIDWQKCLGGTSDDQPYNICGNDTKGYLIAGYSKSVDGDVSSFIGGQGDFWAVKLVGTTGIEEIPTSSIPISPNPTTGIITIKGIIQPTVAVYNLMGQKVVAAQGSNEVNLSSLPAGMYLVQVFNKDMELVKSEKVIKE